MKHKPKQKNKQNNVSLKRKIFITMCMQTLSQIIKKISKVGGSSYLLWAIENFKEFHDLAERIAEKEVKVINESTLDHKINENVMTR